MSASSGEPEWQDVVRVLPLPSGGGSLKITILEGDAVGMEISGQEIVIDSFPRGQIREFRAIGTTERGDRVLAGQVRILRTFSDRFQILN